MSEELRQRNLIETPEKFGKWDFYNIGATTINALKNHNIIPKKTYDSKYLRKKPDALIVENQNVIALIEHKQPKQLSSDKLKEKAINQELDVAKAIGSKILIVTDKADVSIWINPITGEKILDEEGNEITLRFKENDEKVIEIIEKIIDSISETNSQLVPKKIQNPSPLSKQIWQDIWSVSGATPENCLYTFVEIFIFKYLSDLNILRGIYSFDNLLIQYENNTHEEVLEYYADTIRKEIKKQFPYNKKDNTTIINGTVFVSKDDKAVEGYGTVFKKILERFKSFGKLENIDTDFKSQLFESFLKESISKKNWGQFFTPLKVIQAISKAVEIKEGMSICDPACGVGKFLLEPIKNDITKFYKVENGVLKPKIKLVGYDKGFDKDEQKTIILAKANMLIYFSELISKNYTITTDFSDLFNETFELKTNSILGTLREPSEEEFDLILTNPPYVTSGSSNLKDEIEKNGLYNYYTVNALGVEGLFMEWIIKALKKNGKAFVVVPDGILHRANDKRLRDFILRECILDAVISLPINTFFTTPKKTYILALTKKENRDDIQEDKVFTYLVSDIGETLDNYRFKTDENHLDDSINLFNQFKGSKKFFKTEDKRCKLLNIEDFLYNQSWMIDKSWTEEEKISLGIKKISNTKNLSSFIDDITEMQNDFSSYKEQLNSLENTLQALEKSANYDTVELDEIIDFSQKTNSSKFTKRFIEKHKGDIPVYSASKDASIVGYGYVEDNLEGIKYFDDCLTWNIDGSIGKAHYREGRFSLSEKVIPLIIKKEYRDLIDISYLKYRIEIEAKKEDYNYSNKAGKGKLNKLETLMPINEKGKIDINIQREISDLHNSIEEIQKEITNKLLALTALQVDINL